METLGTIEQPIGLAVIGYGGMGSYHAWKILEQLSGKITLIGVYDIREVRQEAAREKGIYTFPSREALLSDPRVELVTVATPNDSHKEIVLNALHHGKHVICEKPVTIASSADLEEMIAAAEQAGRLFTVHQNRRWDPDYLTAKEILEGNPLGRVFNVESRVHGSRGVPGDWRALKATGGGMLLDWGIHMLDQMLTLNEHRKLLSLYAQLTYVTCDEVDDGFRVFCRFENDLTFMVEILTSNFIELPRWYILGENGTAIVKNWGRDGEIVKVSDWENRESVPVQAGVGITKTMAPRTNDTIQRYPLPLPAGDWLEYYHNIFDVIRCGAPPIVTHNQQRRLMKLIEAILTSGEENRVVTFAEGL
ncbi:MAG: Gfo/Idh/MocA family oxidoreductase [Oscillospiraceae bacterium]|jgi:predicted dehydrogenase|nr:Gfo/Idh/MocA family oxidoreductase [Oscillospiraceae bacterium]